MHELFPKQSQVRPPKKSLIRTVRAQLRRALMTPEQRVERRRALRLLTGKQR